MEEQWYMSMLTQVTNGFWSLAHCQIIWTKTVGKIYQRFSFSFCVFGWYFFCGTKTVFTGLTHQYDYRCIRSNYLLLQGSGKNAKWIQLCLEILVIQSPLVAHEGHTTSGRSLKEVLTGIFLFWAFYHSLDIYFCDCVQSQQFNWITTGTLQ